MYAVLVKGLWGPNNTTIVDIVQNNCSWYNTIRLYQMQYYIVFDAVCLYLMQYYCIDIILILDLIQYNITLFDTIQLNCILYNTIQLHLMDGTPTSVHTRMHDRAREHRLCQAAVCQRLFQGPNTFSAPSRLGFRTCTPRSYRQSVLSFQPSCPHGVGLRNVVVGWFVEIFVERCLYWRAVLVWSAGGMAGPGDVSFCRSYF